MTKGEAAKLLAHAAAFDNRTVGEADAAAWSAALHDLPGDVDAFAAVARFYSEPTRDGETGRRWIEPHHVRTWRKKIRAERLGDTIPAYTPSDRDESGPEFVARRRAQLAAIADGRMEPTPVRQLAGGPHPGVQRALEGAVRAVDDELADRPYVPQGFRERAGMSGRGPELRFACPKQGCGARERQPCRTPMGKPRSESHLARRELLQDGGA